MVRKNVRGNFIYSVRSSKVNENKFLLCLQVDSFRGFLPVLKLRSYKVRRAALEQFLEKYEGKDLTNPYEVRDIDLDEKRSNVGA